MAVSSKSEPFKDSKVVFYRTYDQVFVEEKSSAWYHNPEEFLNRLGEVKIGVLRPQLTLVTPDIE